MGEKVYRPWQGFNKLYAAVVTLLKAAQFSVAGIDLGHCERDVQEQAAQQAAVQLLLAQYREQCAKFAVDQRERYRRFRGLLSAARAVYAHDPVMMAALAQFRFQLRRSRNAGEVPAENNTPPANSSVKTDPRTTAMA